LMKVHAMGIALVFVVAATGCASTKVHVDPASVASVSLKLPTAEQTFCPGKAMRIDVVAKMADGSTCATGERGNCLGQQDVSIDPADVRFEGVGELKRTDAGLFFMPNRDALATAENGMSVRAWIEQAFQGQVRRSPIADVV